MLQDPRPIALEEAVAEALGVERLQLEPLLLEIGLPALADRELGGDVVINGALDLLGDPQPAPAKLLEAVHWVKL